MMRHWYCEEYVSEVEEAEQVILTGIIVDKNAKSIELVSDGSNFIVLVDGAWIIDYGNKTIDIVDSNKLLSNYIDVNSTVVVIEYKSTRNIDEYNIVLPKEIVLVDKGFAAKSIEYEKSNMEEEHCHIP